MLLLGVVLLSARLCRVRTLSMERLTVTLDVVSSEAVLSCGVAGGSVLNETVDGRSFFRGSFLQQRLKR